MSKETILAVGAAGKFAGLVVTALAERNVRVRGLARNEEKAARIGWTIIACTAIHWCSRLYWATSRARWAIT
jgi:hypothetical protein